VDLPRRIFAAVLARLETGPEDPAWSLAFCPARPPVPRRFIAPAVWREGLAAGRGALRLSKEADAQALWDPSGRLLLGAWQGPCPRPLLAARRRASPGAATGGEGDRIELVTHAWLTASRRWLRRYAGIGLADLVRRPAHLALTPTHVDLHFDLAQADLRLRRAGLDLDPGWLPWLGRVVSFHYAQRGGP